MYLAATVCIIIHHYHVKIYMYMYNSHLCNFLHLQATMMTMIASMTANMAPITTAEAMGPAQEHVQEPRKYLKAK